MVQSLLLQHGDGAQTHVGVSAGMPCCTQHKTIKNANYMYTIYSSASESHKGYRVVSAIVQIIQHCNALTQQASGTVTQQNAH